MLRKSFPKQSTSALRADQSQKVRSGRMMTKSRCNVDTRLRTPAIDNCCASVIGLFRWKALLFVIFLRFSEFTYAAFDCRLMLKVCGLSGIAQ